jgi:hypothetical protein
MDKNAWAAARMLDKDVTVRTEDGDLKTTRDDYLQALKPGDQPEAKEDLIRHQQIRKCFDALFYSMGLIQHDVEIDLIKLEDVKFPFNYYVRLMEPPDLFTTYMRDNKHDNALKLFDMLRKEDGE